MTPSLRAGTARLARALVRDLARALPALAGEAREHGLAAVDEFVARPAPGSYLRAARRLSELARAHRSSAAAHTLAERAFADGLALLAESGAVDDDTLAALARLPVDARAGLRLAALSHLIIAHGEVAARVRRADELRVPLTAPAPVPLSAPRAPRSRSPR